MNGGIITDAEMTEAGRLANVVARVGIQHGLDEDLSEVVNFLNHLKWKNQER